MHLAVLFCSFNILFFVVCTPQGRPPVGPLDQRMLNLNHSTVYFYQFTLIRYTTHNPVKNHRAGEGQGGGRVPRGWVSSKGYRGSNRNILKPRCGPSTVEGGRNGPYQLRDYVDDDT